MPGRIRQMPGRGTIVFAAIYLALEAVPSVLATLFVHSAHLRSDIIFGDLNNLQIMLKWRVLLIASAVYGLTRLRMHPLLGKNRGYLWWLRTTPWTSRLQLPLGPIHLVWFDFVKLGGLAALAYWDIHQDPVWLLVVFGASYLLVGTYVLAISSAPEAYLLAIGAGGVCVAAQDNRIMALILVVMYGVFYMGLRRQLKNLVWDEPARQKSAAERLAKPLGWPLDALAPGREFKSVTYTRAIAAATLAGWLIYCAGYQIELANGRNFDMAWVFGIGFALFAAFVRFIRYGENTKAPITLWGRFGTGQLIIPRYDYVFLAPWAVIAASVAVIVVGQSFFASPSLVLGLAIGAGLLVALTAGPSLRHWQLTGEYQFVPTAKRRVRLKNAKIF